MHVSSASQKLRNFSQKTTVWSCPFPILSSLLTSFSLVGEHQGPTSEFRVCLRRFSAAVVEGVSDRDCKPSAALASSQGAPNRASPALGRIPARSSLATRRQQPRHFPLPLVACEQRAHLDTPTLLSQSSLNSTYSLRCLDLAFVSCFPLSKESPQRLFNSPLVNFRRMFPKGSSP